MLCTDRGQVLLLTGERSVFDLNAEVSERLAAERNKLRAAGGRDELLGDVRSLAAIRPLEQLSKPTSNRAGKVERDGYHIDKLVIHTDSGVPLPALTYHPAEPAEEAYLYLHDGGKASDGGPGGPIEKLVRDGYVVVSVDLSGKGETAVGKGDPKLGDWKTFYMAYLLGKSVVGKHAEDILAVGQWTANYQSKEPREVHLIAVGGTSVAALHAAALDPELFTTVTLRGGPSSWSKVTESASDARWLTTTVHGALRKYDLLDLVKALPEGKVRIEQ